MMPPFEAIIAAIEAHQTFLIAAHVGPDGDAIGSGLALRLGLEAMGKQAVLVSTDGIPNSCRYLPFSDTVLTMPKVVPQCVFVIDCDGTPNRVAAPFEFIERAKFKILIDHHRTAKPIFDLNWIDPTQPATALMIYHLLQKMPIQITRDMAQCLICGLSTDTGNFRFPNTTPECLRAAADLIERGADIAETAYKTFDERSFAGVALLGLALQKMKAEADGLLMWSALSEADFTSVDAQDESSENVVNLLRNVRGAQMAIVFRERRDETGPTARISIRARPELRADLFAQQFGGGGHAAASGCRVRYKPFEESVQTVVEAAKTWVHQEHPPLQDDL